MANTYQNDQVELNRDPHDPNKGLNVRTFSWVVIAALVVLLASALVIVRANRTKVVSHAVQEKPVKSGTSPQ